MKMLSYFPRTKGPDFCGGERILPWNDAELDRFLVWLEENEVEVTTAYTWPRKWTRQVYRIRTGKAFNVKVRHYWESEAGEVETPENPAAEEVVLKRISGGPIHPHISGLPIEGI